MNNKNSNTRLQSATKIAFIGVAASLVFAGYSYWTIAIDVGPSYVQDELLSSIARDIVFHVSLLVFLGVFHSEQD